MSEPVRGLLDGISAIAAIQQEQDCSWDAAKQLWEISLEMEEEAARDAIAAAAESNVIPFRRKH